MSNMASPYLYMLGYVCLTFVSGQDPELTILVGDWTPGRVYHLSLSAGVLRAVPIPSIIRPVAIDYDYQTRDIYWTDVSLKQIRSTNVLGTNDRILQSLNESAVLDGLAVDLTNRKVFYSDAGNDVIAVMEMDGSNMEVIVDSDLDQPRAIVLHEEKRKLFWSDWGAKPYIATANYDGTNITKIVTSGLVWPNGLTLDKQNNVLYWCDAKTHNIESVNTDGTQRRMILHEPEAHYFDIFYNQGALYFTDWKRRAVINVPAGGGSIGIINSKLFTQLAGIHVYSSGNTSACPAGQYGNNCDDCGHCKDNSVCEKTIGFCLAACTPGYEGTKCIQKCSNNTYGDKCESVCGNCGVGGCHHFDGRCLAGCTPGWKGVDCKSECSAGTHGDKCKSVCDNCDGGDCHHVDGRCPAGCTPGWQGVDCKTECSARTYGYKCQSVCGNCERGECHHVDGSCQIGCVAGWQGIDCKILEDDDKEDDNSNHSLIVIVGAAAGGVAVLLIAVVIIVIVVVVLLRRKKTSRRQPKPERDYSSLDNDRQSNIYSVPADLPPPYSTITELNTFRDGYAGLGGTGPYVTTPGYTTLGWTSSHSTTEEHEDNVYERPFSLAMEDEKNHEK